MRLTDFFSVRQLLVNDIRLVTSLNELILGSRPPVEHTTHTFLALSDSF